MSIWKLIKEIVKAPFKLGVSKHHRAHMRRVGINMPPRLLQHRGPPGLRTGLLPDTIIPDGRDIALAVMAFTMGCGFALAAVTLAPPGSNEKQNKKKDEGGAALALTTEPSPAAGPKGVASNDAENLHAQVFWNQ